MTEDQARLRLSITGRAGRTCLQIVGWLAAISHTIRGLDNSVALKMARMERNT